MQRADSDEEHRLLSQPGRPPGAGPSPDETGRPGRSRTVPRASTRGAPAGSVGPSARTRHLPWELPPGQWPSTTIRRWGTLTGSASILGRTRIGGRPAGPGLRRDRDTAGHGVSRRTPGELFHGVHDVSLVITNRPPGPRVLPANPASRCKPRDQLINLLHCQAAVDPDRRALSFRT